MLNKCDFILSRGQIEVLGEISSSGFIFVFDNIRDHAGILKILTDANPNVYQFLMHHPHMNLCTVYEYWKEGDQLFVFEEYINGQTLIGRKEISSLYLRNTLTGRHLMSGFVKAGSVKVRL